jgi:hypothetical protein
LNERSEPRWSGISAMLRWAVIYFLITVCITFYCQENGNNIMLSVKR